MWQALATLGAGMLGAGGGIFSNERNLAYQRDTQDYMKAMQQVAWQREDTAVQRRVADLKAAGLSPVLAAGSSAASSAPVKIDPLSGQDYLGTEGFMAGVTKAAQTQQSFMNMRAQQAQVDLMDAQKKLIGVNALIAGKQLLLYGETAADARRHPQYENQYVRMAEMALDGLQSIFKNDPRDVAAGKKSAASMGLPYTPGWVVEAEKRKRTGR